MSSMRIRKPAVAGLFYEADAGRLQQHIAALIDSTEARSTELPRALIVPHAGYVYSGHTAAQAYRCLQSVKHRIHRVALFGPAHRVYLQGMAVPSVDAFETPLGQLPLDRKAISQLAQMPAVVVADEAHREEHSLEVQLPFLQSILDEFTLVPVVVGSCDPQSVADAMDALCIDPQTLLVVSSDLSHFHHYEQANIIDRRSCERLLAKDDSLLGAEACGANALNGLMRSRTASALQVELLERCNSGDTGGDRDRVVGYGSFILH